MATEIEQATHTAKFAHTTEIVRRYRFKVEDYRRLIETGVLTECDRVELIEGEIIEMSPTGKRHAACVNRLNSIFKRVKDTDAIISVQNPLLLPDDSEPQPDVMLLKSRADFYEEAEPQARDVLLLIEVSDTTLEYDRRIKLPLYAASGVAEMWIVNIEEERIEIYTEPKNNTYSLARIAQRGERVAPQAFPQIKIKVSDVLGG